MNSFKNVVFLVVLILGTMTIHAEDENPAAVIRVVKNWEDLLKIEPIDLGNGVKIRLGIEDVKIPVHSGVFLYCFTEEFQPPKRWNRGDLIGPVTINSSQRILNGIYHEPDEGEGTLSLVHGFGQEAYQPQPKGLKSCQLLFLRQIYAVKPGKLIIDVYKKERDAPGQHLATCTIKCTDEAFHAWMPWKELDEADENPKRNDFEVSNRGGGIGLPYVLPLRPIVFSGKVAGKKYQTNPSDALPELIPKKPSSGFRISETAGVLTVRSKAGIDIWGPYYSFLTRWWVNGKPFHPKQAPYKERFYHDNPDSDTDLIFEILAGSGAPSTEVKPPEAVQNGQVTVPENLPTEVVQLRLKLDLKKLGAKKGDRIGLQLLHCDDGWDSVTSGRSGIPKGWDRAVLPELSNRIEFVAQ